jgi:hypothetical protein
MIERKVVLDQAEPNRSGVLGVRMAILLIEDGQEISCDWHRTAIPMDVDPQLQMNAVNAHLALMEMPQIPQIDIDLVKNAHALMVARYSTIE